MSKVTEDITRKALIDTVLNANLKKLKILLDGGVNPNTMIFDRVPILSIAINAICAENLSSMEQIVSYLIENKADVNLVDDTGATPLMHSCMNKLCSKNIVDILLTNGADVNVKDKNDQTALDYAVKYNNVQVIKRLITSCRNKGIRSVVVSTNSATTMLEAGWSQNRDLGKNGDPTIHPRSYTDSFEKEKMFIGRSRRRVKSKSNGTEESFTSSEIDDEFSLLDVGHPVRKDHVQKQGKSKSNVFPNLFRKDGEQKHRMPLLKSKSDETPSNHHNNVGLSDLEKEKENGVCNQKHCIRRPKIRNNSESSSITDTSSEELSNNPFVDANPNTTEEVDSPDFFKVRRRWCRRLSDDISRSRRLEINRLETDIPGYQNVDQTTLS